MGLNVICQVPPSNSIVSVVVAVKWTVLTLVRNNEPVAKTYLHRRC